MGSIAVRPLDESKVVLYIWAANDQAQQTFKLEHNKHLIPREKRSHRLRKRESTPVFLAPVPPTEIVLQLDCGPRDPSRGWCFGSDPESCDGLLDKSNYRGISKVHFEVTFNRRSLAIVLTNISKSTSTIVLPKQDPEGFGTRQTRALPTEPGMTLLHVGLLQYVLEVPDHEKHQATYDANVRTFLQSAQIAVPLFSRLNLRTDVNPTPAVIEHRYFEKQRLGSGKHSRVSLGLDGLTGDPVALKYFLNEDVFKAEAVILKRLHHDHIIRFIDSVERERLLVLELAAFGTLEDSPNLSYPQLYHLAIQMTSALHYIHEQGIIHRDVKPANILLVSKNPFRATLADFSIMSEKSNARSFVGTILYCAPEVGASTYSNLVDIFSLGVVIVERWYDWYGDYVYELGDAQDDFFWNRDTFLPATQCDNDTVERGLARKKARDSLPKWTNTLRDRWVVSVRAKLEKAKNESNNPHDVAIAFLGMFEPEPARRWTAKDCHNYFKERENDYVILPLPNSSLPPSKKTKLSHEPPSCRPTILAGAEIFLLPKDRLVCATDLWKASSKRAWPQTAVLQPFNTSSGIIPRRTAHWVSYSDGLELASLLEFPQTSRTILETKMKHALGNHSKVEIPMIPNDNQEDTNGQEIVHLWPPESLISATHIVRAAGGHETARTLNAISIQASRKHWHGMPGLYVGYEEGLQLCEYLGLPSQEIEVAITKAYLGPMISRRPPWTTEQCVEIFNGSAHERNEDQNSGQSGDKGGDESGDE